MYCINPHIYLHYLYSNMCITIRSIFSTIIRQLLQILHHIYAQNRSRIQLSLYTNEWTPTLFEKNYHKSIITKTTREDTIYYNKHYNAACILFALLFFHILHTHTLKKLSIIFFVWYRSLNAVDLLYSLSSLDDSRQCSRAFFPRIDRYIVL